MDADAAPAAAAHTRSSICQQASELRPDVRLQQPRWKMGAANAPVNHSKWPILSLITKAVRNMLPGRSKYNSAPSVRFCRPYRSALCNTLWSFVVMWSIFSSLPGMYMLYIMPPMTVKEHESCRPSANLMPPYLLLVLLVVILANANWSQNCHQSISLFTETVFSPDSLQTLLLRAVSSGSWFLSVSLHKRIPPMHDRLAS